MTASRSTHRLGGLRRAAGVGVACATCLAGSAWAQAPSAADTGSPAVEVNEAVLDALGPPVRSRAAAALVLTRPVRRTLTAPPALVRRAECDPVAAAVIGSDGLPIFDGTRGCPHSRTIGLSMRSDTDDGPAPVRLRRPGAGAERTEPVDGTTPPPAATEALPPRPSAVPPPPPPAAPETPETPPRPTAAEPERELPAPPAVETAGATRVLSEDVPEAATAAEDLTVAAAPAPRARPLATVLSVPFASGDSDLSPAARQTLDRVAESLGTEPAERIQLKAYADAEGTTSSAARRMSMLRALSVRSYLMETGVSSTRIDVRALGAKYESGPPDRVDIVGVR